MKVLALDFGPARTGVAVSDPTGTIARPLGVVEQAASEEGLARLAQLVVSEHVDRVVVGLPLTLRGRHGEQAQATERFAETLRPLVAVPVETWDERFTTTLASSLPGSASAEDARAAAHLLSSYLAWTSRQTA